MQLLMQKLPYQVGRIARETSHNWPESREYEVQFSHQTSDRVAPNWLSLLMQQGNSEGNANKMPGAGQRMQGQFRTINSIGKGQSQIRARWA
jgi:hypothetical protein